MHDAEHADANDRPRGTREPARVPAQPHPVTQMPSAIGNRAMGHLIQRRLAIKPADLGSTGTFGQVKALVGQSDYTKIRETLAKYHATAVGDERAALVQRMKVLVARWLVANQGGKSSGNADRVRKIQALQAALVAEEAELAEGSAYLGNLKQKGHYKWISNFAAHATTGADNLAHGKTGSAEGQTDEAQRVMKESGITDADLAAIRLYSSDDFKYINPAMAGNDPWLKTASSPLRDYAGIWYRAPDRKGVKQDEVDKEWRKLLSDQDWSAMGAEGAEHGKMVTKALSKLPVYDGPTFRGEQLSQADADKRWTPGVTFTTQNFYSTSRNQAVGEFFAQDNPSPDRPIKILIRFAQKTGRDISALSAAPKNYKLEAAGLGSSEEEVLLLPGVTIRVASLDKSGPVWIVDAVEESADDDLQIPAIMPALPAIPGSGSSAAAKSRRGR